jgi:hypothetical protein
LPDDPLRFSVDVGGAWDPHILPVASGRSQVIREDFATRVRTGVAREARFRTRGADGKYRSFLNGAGPLRPSDVTPLYWIGINLDIDDAMQAGETLTLTKVRLDLTIGAATRHRVIHCNRSWDRAASVCDGGECRRGTPLA